MSEALRLRELISQRVNRIERRELLVTREEMMHQVNKAWRGHLVEEPEALKKLLPWIVTCHLHDNNGLGDQHQLPGRGTIDWEHLMPELLAAPRLVSCQSEVGFLLYNIPIRTLCETMSRLVGGN